MTVTAIDSVSALIVVDLQNGAKSNPFVHPIADVAGRAAALAAAYRAAGLPVVLMTYVGGASGRSDMARNRAASGAVTPAPAEGWDQLLDVLDEQPSDHAIARSTWGSFYGTDLQDHLAGLGVTQVVIAGVATSLGVESTAREARDRGYNVVLATDAMTDMNPTAHEQSLSWAFPLLGEVAATDEVLALVAAR